MKRTIILGSFLLTVFAAQAQWTTTGTAPNTITSTNTGMVGIGTTTPGAALQVNSKNTAGVTITDIGGQSGALNLGVVFGGGNYTSYSKVGDAVIRGMGSEKLLIASLGGDQAGVTNSEKIVLLTNRLVGGELPALKVFRNGNISMTASVLIGATAPTTAHTDYRLAVDGKLIAKSFYLPTATEWPDFVFDKNYKLASLKEVEAYIQANHHLPALPSSEEIKESGINMGEIVTLQMQKIEELTLHMIELQKQNEKLATEVAGLKK